MQSALAEAADAQVAELSVPREGEADLRLADLAPASQLVQASGARVERVWRRHCRRTWRNARVYCAAVHAKCAGCCFGIPVTNRDSCSLQAQARELLKRNWQQYARLWRSYTAARMLITVRWLRGVVTVGGGCGLVTAGFSTRPRVCTCASCTAVEEHAALLLRSMLHCC